MYTPYGRGGNSALDTNLTIIIMSEDNFWMRSDKRLIYVFTEPLQTPSWYYNFTHIILKREEMLHAFWQATLLGAGTLGRRTCSIGQHPCLAVDLEGFGAGCVWTVASRATIRCVTIRPNNLTLRYYKPRVRRKNAEGSNTVSGVDSFLNNNPVSRRGSWLHGVTRGAIWCGFCTAIMAIFTV
jgi:hypothetical protein